LLFIQPTPYYLFLIPCAHFSASPVSPVSSGKEDSVELSTESVEIRGYIKCTGKTGTSCPNEQGLFYLTSDLCSRVALHLHYDKNICLLELTAEA
jgi:hypothetical protein